MGSRFGAARPALPWSAMPPQRAASLASLLVALILAPACAASPPLPSAGATLVAISTSPPAAEMPELPAHEDPPAADGRVITGMGDIHIGQPIEEVRRLLGPETETLSEETDREGWREQNYDPDQELVFMLGFDTLLVWNELSEAVKLPFWKIYAREGRVIYMVLSAFTAELDVTGVGFPPSCFMSREPSAIDATFGPGHIHERDEKHGYESYHYLDRGITVITVDDEIGVFHIYGAIPAATHRRFRQTLAR